jgi:hypothetical protein
MNDERSGGLGPVSAGRRYAWLEGLTAGVLVAVVVSLGWMILSAYQPDWVSWGSTEVQVVVICALLLAALLLVSVVALLHTRS